jgi:hypothetical protein
MRRPSGSHRREGPRRPLRPLSLQREGLSHEVPSRLGLRAVGEARRITVEGLADPLRRSSAPARLVDEHGEDLGPYATSDVRADIVDMLSKAGRTRGGAGIAKAKVRVVVNSVLDVGDCGTSDGFGCLMLVPYAPFVFLGAETTDVRVSIDLTLESNGQTYRGHGDARKIGSIYVGGRRRALAAALDRALALR